MNSYEAETNSSEAPEGVESIMLRAEALLTEERIARIKNRFDITVGVPLNGAGDMGKPIDDIQHIIQTEGDILRVELGFKENPLSGVDMAAYLPEEHPARTNENGNTNVVAYLIDGNEVIIGYMVGDTDTGTFVPDMAVIKNELIAMCCKKVIE